MFSSLAAAALTVLALGGCDRVFGLVGDLPPTDASRDSDTDATSDSLLPDVLTSLYVSAVLGDGPVGYYRLGELSGTAARSEAPDGPTGTYMGAVQLGQSGALPADTNTAALFGGADEARGAVVFGDVFDFDGILPFTLEAWLSPSEATEGQYYNVMSKWLVPPANSGYWLFLVDRKLVFARGVDEDTNDAIESAPLPLNTWTHVAAVYDGEQLHLYLNGVSIGSMASSLELENESVAFALGTGNGMLSNNPYFGLLDEVAVFDKALNDVQIAGHYTAASL